MIPTIRTNFISLQIKATTNKSRKMRYFGIKTTLILFAMAFASLDAFAISKENERMAKQLINEYYALLQEYANRPLINNQYAIQQLFANPSLNGSWVMNDLKILKGEVNGEDDLGNFLSTFAHQDIEKLKVHFEYKIDDKSMKEQLVEIKDKNNPINYTNIWVWVDKTIMAEGHKPIKNRETFKIVNGKIEAITSPETASYRINGIELFNKKKYKEAFEVFEKNINEGKASISDYRLAAYILWLNKSGKSYPKIVRDVMTVHYYAKGNYRYCMNVVLKYWIYPLLHCNNTDDILNNQNNLYGYFRETREWSYNQPVSQGLVRIGKKDKKSGQYEFGFINTKGEIKIPYRFREAHRFTKEGVALVRDKESKLYGLIDINGNYVTKKGYKDAMPLHSDENSQLIAVKNDNGKWGYINNNGEEVLPFGFDFATNFLDTLALVVQDNKIYYINGKGEFINGTITWKDNSMTIQGGMEKDYIKLMYVKELSSISYFDYKFRNKDILK